MSNNTVDLAGFLALQRPATAQPENVTGWLFTGRVAIAGERHTLVLHGAPLRALLNLLDRELPRYVVDTAPTAPPFTARACTVRGKLLSQNGQSVVLVKNIHLVDVKNPLSSEWFANNRITLQGKLKVRRDTAGEWAEATIMTDEIDAGGHHPLIFVKPLAQQVRALTGVREATVAGRLVSLSHRNHHNFILVNYLSF